MNTDMPAARAILADAQKTAEAAQRQILAIMDGQVAEVKELVRTVFAAGYELPGLNDTLGMIEMCENKGHALVSGLAAVAQKIQEVRG